MSKTIIIVDDNQRVLAGVARVITRGGFVAAPFASLGSALEAINASRVAPAAAIIDVYLEHGRQGFELSDVIRERFGASVPILMITGYHLDLTPPYWSPSQSDHVASAPWVLDERIPVYEKPIKAVLLSTFLVRAVATCDLKRAPVELRSAVIAYALQRQLTPQEARVLARLACGSTRSSLPNDLGLSKDTVKSQIRNMLKKCKVSCTEEIIAALLRYIFGGKFWSQRLWAAPCTPPRQAPRQALRDSRPLARANPLRTSYQTGRPSQSRTYQEAWLQIWFHRGCAAGRVL